MKKREINSIELYPQLSKEGIERATIKKGIPLIIVSTLYHKEITGSMVTSFLESANFDNDSDTYAIVEVPGAFELPLIIKIILEKYIPKQVLALGCIIKGETNHDEYLASTVINGLRNLSLEYKTPVINGVLTTNTLQQAIDRAGKKYNKGKDFADTYNKMSVLLDKIKNE